MRIAIDGQAVEAEPGDTVAAALLRNGVTTFTRSIKYHRPRGPFCLQGSCGQCLMRIDGVPSLLACRTPAEEGMNCERQNGPLGVDTDLFRAADFLFPEKLDHHHLMTGSRLLGRVALEIARRLAGLGELPAGARAAVRGELRKAQVVIIGCGRSGRLAATPGALILEREACAAETPPGELLLEAECVGLYANDTPMPGNALLAVRQRDRLIAIVAEKVIVATGGVSQPLPFAGVDRPGVYAARGLIDLHRRCAVRVGERLALIGEGDELRFCARELEKIGYQLARVLDKPAPESLRALGKPVRALQVGSERIACDAVAIAQPLAPLHELATSAGATARWSSAAGGFCVQTDAEGRTSVPWLFATGRCACR